MKPRDIPLLKILVLKDLDRVNPVFWPVFFGIVFIFLGILSSFFKFLAWCGGGILIIYLAVAGIYLYNGLK